MGDGDDWRLFDREDVSGGSSRNSKLVKPCGRVRGGVMPRGGRGGGGVDTPLLGGSDVVDALLRGGNVSSVDKTIVRLRAGYEGALEV